MTNPSTPSEEKPVVDVEKPVAPVEKVEPSQPSQPAVSVIPEAGVVTESGEKIVATVDSQVVVEDSLGNQVVKSAAKFQVEVSHH